MKTLHLSIIVIPCIAMLILSMVFVTMPQSAYASDCGIKETSLTIPQFYRLSDAVFVGTVSSVQNNSNHQWMVKFNTEKIWKGTQSPTITIITGSIQACGYSLVLGEKYLIFANGSPLDYISWFSKPFADAQADITIFDDPQFQAQEKNKEELNKKLETAKEVIGNMMASNTSGIPFNMVGIDEINSTLNIGIDNTKATLSEEEYQKKIKEIVGDIPIKITFGQIVADTGNPSNNVLGKDSLSSLVPTPLTQFKSGIASKDVTCEVDLHLVIKTEDGSPACVRPETAQKLVERGWGSLVGAISTVKITSVNDCGQFYPAPENHGNSTKIPVLMMNLTSTGCARLYYTMDYDYNSNPNGPAWSRIANFTSSLPIDDLNFHGDANQYSISSGKDYTNSFQITVVPPTVDLANYPIGSNFTVTYIIKPLTNATGFYDESILKPLCFRYPLVVGYGADQVNSSDFSMGLAYMQNHSCGLGAPYQITLVEVSGMSYKEMALP